jgi:hypothetical protein
MKTRINKLNKLLIVLISSMIFSCHGELERKDYNQIYPENFFKNESDVSAAVNAVYNSFRCDSYGGGVYKHGRSGYQIFTEVTTDIMDCQWGDGGSWNMLNTHNWSASSTDVTDDLFGYYNVISRAETVAYKINNSSVGDDLKKLRTAELCGLQAWMAFVLYDLYGPVPIASLEVLNNPSEEVIIPRLSEEDYLKYINDKLKIAIDDLPVNSSDWGRLTKGAALMIRMKLNLMLKNWAAVETDARELMKAEYGYGLMDSYKDIFSLEHEKNKELILVVPCNMEGFGNGWISHTLPYAYNYENSNAQKWGGYRMEWDFYNTFETNDERLETIVAEFTATDGTVYNQTNPGEQLAKGALPLKYGVDPAQVGHKSNIDVVVFRYADVLLSLAEAINEIKNGPTTEAIGLINKVRDRVGLDDLTAAQTANQSVFNTAILKERGHEFYCEGLRRQDLIRHGKYIEVAQQNPNSQIKAYKTKFPIPNSVIVETEGKVLQTSGY